MSNKSPYPKTPILNPETMSNSKRWKTMNKTTEELAEEFGFNECPECGQIYIAAQNLYNEHLQQCSGEELSN